MFFEAEEEQIARIESLQLVQLMKRLLLAECRTVDIPLRATTVPVQITVADGGEDGRVDWTGGSDSTDFFPGRFSVFQSKAQNLTEKVIAANFIVRRFATFKRSRHRPHFGLDQLTVMVPPS